MPAPRIAGFVRHDLVAAIVVLGGSGCVTLVPGEPVALVDHFDWVKVDGDDDPFDSESHRTRACDPAGYLQIDFSGEPSWEVKTDFCEAVTVSQPILAPIGKGDVLRVRGWHYPLSAPEPAEAIFALALEGEEVFSRAIPIPQEQGGVVFAEFPSEVDLPAGATTSFHVRNHGKNTYHLIEWSVRPLVPERELEE